MRPPSTLLQLNAILVLFCAAAMLFTNEADGQPPPPPPQPQQDNDTLGLGGFPISKDGKVEIDLPSGTKLIKNKEEFKEYQHNDKTFEPCNVEFNTDGNIEVFYDDLASTKGCTVDLLVNIADDKDKQIKFVAKVEDKEKNCVTFNDDNVLPFIFNEANNGLTTLTNGPIAGDEKDCANKEECKKKTNEGKCIKRTMFQIGWVRVRSNPNIMGYLNQVAEPVSAWTLWGNNNGVNLKMDVKIAVGSVPENKPLVTITALDVPEAKSVEFPDGIKDNKPVCNKPRMATLPPAIWKVNSENKEFKDKYFVTFHFFPQKSIRISGEPDISPKGGPKCKGPKQPSFVFSKDFALGILAIPKLPPTTTTKTAIGSTTATELKSTTTTTKIRTTKATTKIRPTKAATKTGPRTAESIASTTSKTTPPGTTEPADGPPLAMITGIVYGYLLVITIIVAVEAYCLFCRKRKDEFVPTEYFYITRRERALMAAANETTNE